jgi:hypothetical protein
MRDTPFGPEVRRVLGDPCGSPSSSRPRHWTLLMITSRSGPRDWRPWPTQPQGLQVPPSTHEFSSTASMATEISSLRRDLRGFVKKSHFDESRPSLFR